MTWAVAVTQTKWYRIICIVVLAACFISLIPAGMVLGDALGGYVTEKLIGGSASSRLVIGGSASSFLDVGTGADVGPTPPTPPAPTPSGSQGYLNLNRLIPLILMGMVVLMMLRGMAQGRVTVLTLLMVAILLYVFYALFPGIQQTITSLFGGP